MLDLRAYRLGFAPALAALVILAFSLEGIPEPLEPPAGTIEFDADAARATARELVRVAPGREPGSEGATAAADLVRRSFEEIAPGSIAEQAFQADVDGEERELRNVLLTLPGSSDQAIVVVAERSSRAGTGAASSAAATAVLGELAAQLGVSGRSRTLIFASIDGAAAAADGIDEMFEALPEHTDVAAGVVISQPGAAELATPHLVTSSGGRSRPSMGLIRTAEEALAARAQAPAGLEGAAAQIARLAIPAAAGTQAALLSNDVDAIAISAAGEVPLTPEDAGEDQLATESLARFGAAALALVGALDAGAVALPDDTSTYLQAGGNTLPGWTIALLALCLMLPPALPIASVLAQARTRGRSDRAAFGWAAEWALVGLAPVLALYALALAGLVPRPQTPYDPGRFGIGPLEVIALLVIAGAAGAAWWVLGLRRAPAGPAPVTLGAAAGAVTLVACLVVWVANPFFALVLAPLAHLVVVFGAGGRRPAALVIPFAIVCALPLAAALLHVAGLLDWGWTAPWQVAIFIAGGGFGLLATAAAAVALAAAAGVVRAALGAAPQASPRGRP